MTQNPAITVTGTADDISLYLQTATIAVALIQYGAGLQNKILEAMTCRTAVISTSKAISVLEAHHGQDLLVVEGLCSFAKSILFMLNDQEQQRELGAVGRRYV